MLAMAALLHMHEATGEAVYLRGAARAARLAVTWSSIWDVPLVPGTTEGGSCNRCPYALTVAPDGTVWVSSIGMGTSARGMVSLYDPVTGDFDPASHTQLRGSAMFAAFVGTKDSYQAFVPEQGAAADTVRVYQSTPRGTAPMEIADVVLDRADCQKAHMLLADGTRGYLVCEGDHVTKPGTLVAIDLQAQTFDSVQVGLFPDGMVVLPPAPQH